MIKGTLLAGVFLFSLPAMGQGILHVKANETLTISRTQQQLSLDELILEKGATINFENGVQNWKVSAQKASFDEGSYINGKGINGEDNAGKVTHADLTSRCKQGNNGIAGLPGGDSNNGINIEMKFGIAAFKSLRIDTSGGQGGSGGDGGKGGLGGKADDCHGGDGGNGGVGGDGGKGGNGGSVSITYWTLGGSEYIPTSNYGPGIQIVTLPGNAGFGGEGGLPGEGGRGTFEKRGSGKKVYRNEGEPGAQGGRGKPGSQGKPGQFLIQPVLAPEINAQ